jgi:peptidyl-prolyl cis-trans isomerase A (cyclophilin A)
MPKMLLRPALIAAALLAAAPALAQTPPATTPPLEAPTSPPPVATPETTPAPTPAPSRPRVELKTPQGAIVIELYNDKAPITANNFLRYVDAKRFDGATFYRASKPKGYTADDYGIVQGGLQNDPAKLFPPIAHEPTTKTGLSHTDGMVSMGRHAPGSATADFFIMIGDQSYLDANPKAPGDNKGFAAFGKVVEGMDVVRKIVMLPRSPTAGVGVMKGEMLQKPVPIVTARRAKAAPPAAAGTTPAPKT